MCTINFTARLVDKPIIKQRSSFFKYKDKDASIVELDCNDLNDLDALCKATDKWQKKHAKFAELLCIGALEDNGLRASNNHYYALTTQTKDLANLKSKNILGLMMFNAGNPSVNEIELLEVKPSTSYTLNIFRKYKNVGKSLVENVKKIFHDRDIVVYSDPTAVGFYKKMGFVNYTKDKLCLLWRSTKCAQ